MGEKLLDLIGKIVTGPKSKLFWVFVIIAVIITVIVFPYIDANFLYYSRIEKRINNLQNMVELSGSPLEENEKLLEEYHSIIAEMDAAREKALSNANKGKDSVHDRRVKFIGGSIIWYIVALAVLFSKEKAAKWTFRKFLNNLLSCGFCIGLGALIGGVFTLLPTIGNVKINVFISLVAEVAVLWLLVEHSKKQDASSAT